MKQNIAALTLSGVTLLSALNAPALANAPSYPPIGPPVLCPQGASTQEAELTLYSKEEIMASLPQVDPQGVYIGGQRFTFDKEDFLPVYRTHTGGIQVAPGEYLSYRYLSGYKTQFQVDGDFGQRLNFDIAGSISKHANIAISCGEFSANDNGSSIQISKQQRTNGSCTAMTIAISAVQDPCGSPRSLPLDYINFTVIISENLE